MTSRDELKRSVERYYTDKAESFGATAAGVDWNSTESQERRFAELLRIVDEGTAYSIVDYGCGYGALVDFLDQRTAPFSYLGFDLSETMIALAADRLLADARCRLTADERQLERSDYAVASGIFNVKLDRTEPEWESYVLETLHSLDRLSRRGFAFNMLTSYSDADRLRSDLYYGNPLFYFDLCKKAFSRHVALLHDYGLWEFTILVRKGER